MADPPAMSGERKEGHGQTTERVDSGAADDNGVAACAPPKAPRFPPWLYLFLPNLAKRAHVRQFGTVQIQVVRATGLRASDYHMFGPAASDPYCIVSVGSDHSRTSRSTKVKHNTLNPVWDSAHFTFPLQFPWSTLGLQVFDHDLTSSDDPLGQASVKLSHLGDGKWHDIEVPLQPDISQLVAASAGSVSGGGGGSKQASGSTHTAGARAGAGAGAGVGKGGGRPRAATGGQGKKGKRGKAKHPASKDDVLAAGAVDDHGHLTTHADRELAGRLRESMQRLQCGTVYLRVKVHLHPYMEMLSHFTPDPVVTDKPPPFHVNAAYANVHKLIDQLWPILELVWGIQAVLQWKTPWWSFVCFLASWWLAAHPGFIVAFLHLVVLWNMFWCYVRSRYADVVHIARVVMVDGMVLESHMAESVLEEQEAAATDLGTWARAADMVLTSSMTEWLGGLQTTVGSLANGLEQFYNLFNFSDHDTSMTIAQGVAASFVFNLFIPLSWLLVAAVVLAFAALTPTFQSFACGVRGIVSYATSNMVKLAIHTNRSAAKQQPAAL